jgi:septal ring-binding cell division protein DamX
MRQIEKSVIAEIETLSGATKEKTDTIENSIESNKAKILKLQSVDEAIIRRATTLEISSAELTVSSQRMDDNIAELQKNSEELFSGVSELKQRTDELEALTTDHGLIINGLQKATSDIADKLSVLAERESKHFNIVTVSLLLLLAVTIVLYFTQQNQFASNDARYAERSENIDGQLSSLQQQQVSSDTQTSDSLAELENRIERVNAAVQDQVQSVEGRFNQASPFSQIGNDNVIHGEQWIAGLPGEHYAVQLAYVDNKNTLFEIAQRYNFYLKDSLSYFTVNDETAEKYVLLSGSYGTQQEAMKAVQAMPAYIDMQRPQIRKLSEIQDYIVR